MATERLTPMRRHCLLIALGLAGCVTISTDTSDVDRFVQRRMLCDHFRGELPDPSDKARLEEIIKKANETCAGTDAHLKALKAKYAHDLKVIKKLSEYDDQVE